MDIKVAQAGDIEEIMRIFDSAKSFMRSTGNDKQWIDGYPSQELILGNISDGGFYTVYSGEGEIVGVFYFKVEADPTYAKIYDGEWLNDEPYGVVHRIASNGKQKGIAGICLDWCLAQCRNIRVDTHRDNIVMQDALRREGFKYCGIIYIANGSERLAFQKSV